MPSYANSLRRIPHRANARAGNGSSVPFPKLVRLLADFHTSMNVPGSRIFSGNIDRFIVFGLLLRISLSRPERSGAISIHSAALSLGRPFETVRRHVCALIDAGFCRRSSEGVTVSDAVWSHPDTAEWMRYAHDCFVRLIADGVDSGVFQAPAVRPVRAFSIEDGVCGAADLMLALLDGNRGLFGEATDLAIFSAILHANAQRFEADAAAVGDAPCGLLPRHAVRVAEVARALTLPDTTVRRRIAAVTGPHGLYVRSRTGLLVSPEQMTCADTLSDDTPRHGSIRLILNRAAAAGLPFGRPASAYLTGRPQSPRLV